MRSWFESNLQLISVFHRQYMYLALQEALDAAVARATGPLGPRWTLSIRQLIDNELGPTPGPRTDHIMA